MRRDPVLRRVFRHVMRGENVDRHLAADLQGVAAVDEYRRFAEQDDGQTGGPLETGQPQQTLRGERDILPLILVGSRYQEAGQTRSPQLRPQSRDPCRRSEEHTSELQSLMRISYAVFCLN